MSRDALPQRMPNERHEASDAMPRRMPPLPVDAAAAADASAMRIYCNSDEAAERCMPCAMMMKYTLR